LIELAFLSFSVFLLSLYILSRKLGTFDEMVVRRSLTIYIVFLFSLGLFTETYVEQLRDILLAVLSFYFATRLVEPFIKRKDIKGAK